MADTLLTPRTGRLNISVRLIENQAEILTSEAVDFLVLLHNEFDARRRELLRSAQRQAPHRRRPGAPDFLTETTSIRQADWKDRPHPFRTDAIGGLRSPAPPTAR